MTKKEIDQQRRRLLNHFGHILLELSRKPKKITAFDYDASTLVRCTPMGEEGFGEVDLRINISFMGEMGIAAIGSDADEPYLIVKAQKSPARKKK